MTFDTAYRLGRPPLAILAALVAGAEAHAQTDPLPSWNDGAGKQAIITFVRATTTSGPRFVAPEARIATFDQDGTLWVEHPMYAQVMYCLDRVPAVVKKKPELAFWNSALRKARSARCCNPGPMRRRDIASDESVFDR